MILEATIPAAGAAALQDTIVGEVPFAGTVTAVTLKPEAAVTGATATARTFNLINKGTNGLGATVIATLVLNTGQNLVAYDEKPFTLGVAANLVVNEGDVLVIDETVAGAGTAHSGGIIEVDISPRGV